jgi:hypothetical protein
MITLCLQENQQTLIINVIKKKTLNKQHTIINKQVKIYKSIETAKSNT